VPGLLGEIAAHCSSSSNRKGDSYQTKDEGKKMSDHTVLRIAKTALRIANEHVKCLERVNTWANECLAAQGDPSELSAKLMILKLYVDEEIRSGREVARATGLISVIVE
jgi:hypothetical protein